MPYNVIGVTFGWYNNNNNKAQVVENSFVLLVVVADLSRSKCKKKKHLKFLRDIFGKLVKISIK